MLDQTVTVAARAAARRLSGQYGPRLEVDVEAALDDGGAELPKQYFDQVALAGLIVAVAQFAYQVYRDHQKDRHKPDRDQVVYAVRVERLKYTDLTRAEEEIIEIVTAEVVKAADAGNELR
jgi:hypothetical protein